MKVVSGKYWCLKFSEVRIRACPSPPQKDVLLDKFLAHAATNNFPPVYISKERRPDSKWLVEVLATLTPHDEIFNKDYVAPPRRKKMEDI